MKNRGSLSSGPSKDIAKSEGNGTPVANNAAKADTDFIAKDELADLLEVGDMELEMRLEEAIMELGRLRQKADAKVTEINVLLSHRLSRMRVRSPFFLCCIYYIELTCL